MKSKINLYQYTRKRTEESKREKTLREIVLPLCTTNDIQEFYEELGCPFFDSLTKQPVTKLAKLQTDIWRLHKDYKLLIIVKSQKIGISSLCILITLLHALTDCQGMELIINAQTDEQAKSHAQDLRRVLGNSPKYKDYLITKAMPEIGLMKDEVTKVKTIYIHNKKNPFMPVKIIVVGMSPGALLSHKRVGFIWSSDFTISQLTADKKNEVWAAMLSRRANTQGPVIIECPARDPSGPVYDAFERFENAKQAGDTLDANHDFHVAPFTYQLGIRDGFFDEAFIAAEKRRLGPLFGTFYNADFFASGHTWYTEEMFKNITPDATENWLAFNTTDDMISEITE